MKIRSTKPPELHWASPPSETHEQAKTTNIVKLGAWHCPPKRINGTHWTSPHIKLQHTLNSVANQILLRCASSCTTLQTLLCYVVNFVMLCCITLCLNFTTLHCKFWYITLCCIASFIALHTLLHYDVILLRYAMNSIVVRYIVILLHYVANSIALCYEVCCIVRQVLLHYVASSASLT